MNMFKSMQLIKKYAKCPKCGNDKLGNGQGGLIVEEDTLRRFCKCGWNITVDGNGNEIKKEIQKMNVTMLGETAYLLKHIEHNNGIGVTRLREDIRKGLLKAHRGSYGRYYVIQTDLDKYLNSKQK